jgi:hypothetical protein
MANAGHHPLTRPQHTVTLELEATMNITNSRRGTLRTAVVALVAAGGLSVAGVGISNATTTGPAPAAVTTAQPGSTASAGVQQLLASAGVQQVLSQYVRDTDHRDGTDLSKLFTPQGTVDIMAKNATGNYQPVGSPLVGRAAIANAVTNLQTPVGGLTSQLHATSDPLVEVHGNTAHLNVEFLTYDIQGATEPATGWPAGTAGAQGTIKPIEVGYYDATFQRVGGSWEISDLRILHDLPVVIPQG